MFINDEKILNEARRGRNIGTFQFNSIGMTKILKRIWPDSIDDIIAANALYRPGPLDAGEHEAFIWRKRNDKLKITENE